MSRKVLVVESEPWLGDHFQRALEKEDITVTRASNAYSAIDLIDKSVPDAIIMSLSLSGASSIALLHELQTYVDTGKIPVIICSNLHNLDIEELRPYGVRHLINSTSMQPTDLAAAVRSVTT
jgi:DNA-binding response OmpR family regulator